MSPAMRCVCFILATIALGDCIDAAEKPQRIVSLSLCTDQLVLMLVKDKQRIAALSHLANDPLYSYMAESASGIHQHNNLAEEIIALQPDLILATTFNNGHAVQMLKRLGYTITTVATPETISDVERITNETGLALGEQNQANNIVQQMQQDISKANALIAGKPEQLAISYGPNGYTAGNKTLKGAILKAAGYKNLAAEFGIEYFGNVSLESLILANPDTIILDEDIPNQDSLAQSVLSHPALQRLQKNKELPRLPSNYWICPGPIASKAILSLAEQRQ